MSTSTYRVTDIQGNVIYEDMPRWPVIPAGHRRMHCPWCWHFVDALPSDVDRALNAHATAAHGWVAKEN